MGCVASNECLTPQHVKRSAFIATEAEERQRTQLAYALVHPMEAALDRLDRVIAIPATHHDDAWTEDNSSRPSLMAAWLEALDRVIARLFIGTLKTTLADAYRNLDDLHRPSKLRFTLHRRAFSYKDFLKYRPGFRTSGIRHGGERKCKGGLVPVAKQSQRKRWIPSFSREEVDPPQPGSKIKSLTVYIWEGDVQCYTSQRHV